MAVSGFGFAARRPTASIVVHPTGVVVRSARCPYRDLGDCLDQLGRDLRRPALIPCNARAGVLLARSGWWRWRLDGALRLVPSPRWSSSGPTSPDPGRSGAALGRLAACRLFAARAAALPVRRGLHQRRRPRQEAFRPRPRNHAWRPGWRFPGVALCRAPAAGGWVLNARVRISIAFQFSEARQKRACCCSRQIALLTPELWTAFFITKRVSASSALRSDIAPHWFSAFWPQTSRAVLLAEVRGISAVSAAEQRRLVGHERCLQPFVARPDRAWPHGSQYKVRAAVTLMHGDWFPVSPERA